MKIAAAIVLLACLATQAFGQSNEYNGVQRTPRAAEATDQIIVKWRGESPVTTAGTSQVQKLSSSLGLQLQRKQQITANTEVLKLEQRLDEADLSSVIARITADPDVEYAVPDRRRWAHALPTDPLVGEQWYFFGAQPAATRAEQAWDVTVGSNTTIVAVLDTGVRFEHPDLGSFAQGGKLLPGFDFVSNIPTANDGNGIDADATDPGDWVSAADAQQPPFNSGNCIPMGSDHVDSSWHGTRVASLIGALTNNAVGMAGTGWNTLLLPVRVLGKCGGFDSDIIQGMRWAAGLPVTGAPTNPNPAQIINLSLGGDGACSAAYQSAMSEISAQGVLVVASVGNEGGAVSTPANCPGVIGVTGLRHAGTKVGFSNLGAGAAIGAPGGNCVNTGLGQPCVFSILVATNTGTTTPGASAYTDQFNFNVGTSFSAPLVAGAAALMHAVNTRLSPSHYGTLLGESAAAFPTGSATTTTVCRVPAGDLQAQECICTTATCGAGMLNTQAAVLAAQRPFAIAQAPTSITAGTTITIDARTSFASNNRSITGYQWSALNVTGAAPAFTDASLAMTTFQVSGNSQFTLRLTVTDDLGSQDTADIAVATPAAPTPTPTPTPPASVPRSGGGGGSMGLLMLGLGILTMFGNRRRFGA